MLVSAELDQSNFSLKTITLCRLSTELSQKNVDRNNSFFEYKKKEVFKFINLPYCQIII